MNQNTISSSMDEPNQSHDLQDIHPISENELDQLDLNSSKGSEDHHSEEHLENFHHDKPKGHPLSLQDFIQRFENANSAEEKLQQAIAYMKATLSQTGTPFFKGFWEARQRCVPLFKENLSSQTRTDFWNEYRELCQESRRLKEILDEQSAFAAEQIEIAINALETDLNQFSEQLKKLAPLVFPFPCSTLEHKKEVYTNLQNELNLLNTHASRINALRKELIKTDMRIRVKNKFFRQLSAAGDHVFPRRKELIKVLSTQFLEDVEGFVKDQFSSEAIQSPLFFLRDEIKALQALAKILTLNTYCFTQTRMRLSECWDMIKELEKERKKVRTEQRITSRQNAEELLQKVEEFKASIESGEINETNLNQKVDDFYHLMQSLKLDREEKQHLREQLNQAKLPLLERIKQEEEKRYQKEHEQEIIKQQKLKELKHKVLHLLDQAENLSAEEIGSERDSILESLQNAPILKAEKQNLEKLLKPLKDVISEKKEKALLSLSDDDLESLEQLREILKQRKERKKEIKGKLEEYKKASRSSSNLDFEKALSFNELLKSETERYEKINSGIKEIEDKIVELETKAKST